MANKIIHIINCSGQQVPNHWESVGVKYLTYFWLDQDAQVVLDPSDLITNECYSFISEAHEKGDGVLIHSVKGQSRACTIVASWIMRRYQWTLLKTLEFLNSRRPDLEIRANFIHQLTDYESRLAAQGIGSKTSKWTEVSEKTNEFENEELLLRNTYLNAQMGPFADFSNLPNYSRPCKLRWLDEKPSLLPLSTLIAEDEVVENIPIEALPTTKESLTAQPIQDNKLTEERIIEQKEDKGPPSITNSDIIPAVDPEASIVNANVEPFQDASIDGQMESIKMIASKEEVQVASKKFETEGYEEHNRISDNRCTEAISKGVFSESTKAQVKEVNSNAKSLAKKETVDNEKQIAAKTVNSENLPRRQQVVENEIRRKEVVKVERLHPSNKRSSKLPSENEIKRANKDDTIRKSQAGKLLAEKINSLSNTKNTRKHTTIKQRPDTNSKLLSSTNQTVNLTVSQRKDISPLSLRTHKGPSIGRPGSKGTPNPQRPEVKKVAAKKVSAAARPSSANVKRDSSITKNGKGKEHRERTKVSSSVRGNKLRKLGSERNILKGSRNEHIKMIEGSVSKEAFNNNCLRLATTDNKVLNSFRNGPIKPSFNPGTKQAKKFEETLKQPVKPSTAQKRQRPASAKDEKGELNGKTNMYRTYDHSKANPPLKTQYNKATNKSITNSMSLKGISPAKNIWKR